MVVEPQAAPRPIPTAEAVPRSNRSWLARWSPLAGVVWFTGTLTFFVLAPTDGDRGETAVEFRDYVQSLTTAQEAWYGAFVIFILLYPLLLGGFVGGLSVRLRGAGADAESVFVLIGGMTFTVLLFLTDMIVIGGLGELSNVDEGSQLAYAQTVLDLERIVWFVQGGGGAGAALMIIAASLGARRTGLVRGRVFWPSLLLGVIALGTIAFVGVFAWFLWIGLASIWMLVRSRA